MLKRLFILPLAAMAMLVAACATTSTAPDWDVEPGGTATVQDAIDRVSEAQESVNSGILNAPPETLSRTTIDERFIRGAFVTFEGALVVIDSLIDLGVITRNSPRALTLRRYVLETDRWLRVASAAQRAGNARDYASAFREASRALGLVRNALVNGS